MENSNTILTGVKLFEYRTAKIQRKARQFKTASGKFVLAQTDKDKAPVQYLKAVK